MPATTEHALAKLIGICREGERELASAARRLHRTDLRVLVLEAFDQRSEMLDALHRLAPDCGLAEPVHVPWVLSAGSGASESTLISECLAGEESTLRAAEQLLFETTDAKLRQVLQTHVLRLRNLVNRFRARPAHMQKV